MLIERQGCCAKALNYGAGMDGVARGVLMSEANGHLSFLELGHVHGHLPVAVDALGRLVGHYLSCIYGDFSQVIATGARELVGGGVLGSDVMGFFN